MNTFGEYIRALRKKEKMTGVFVSREIGKGAAYISHLENQKIANPAYDSSYKLLQVLNVDEAEIEGILSRYRVGIRNSEVRGIVEKKRYKYNRSLLKRIKITMARMDRDHGDSLVSQSIKSDMLNKLEGIRKDEIKLKFLLIAESEPDQELFISVVEEVLSEIKKENEKQED